MTVSTALPASPSLPASSARYDRQPAILTDGTLATVRANPVYYPRERAYISWTTGAGMTDGGHRFTVLPRASLADLLPAIPDPVRTVYLVGPLPGLETAGERFNSFLAWCLPDPGAEWVEDCESDSRKERGHYLDRQQPESSVLRLVHRTSGRPLDIRPFHTWGTDGVNPETARDALRLVTATLRARGRWWDWRDIHSDNAVVLDTPAMTGTRLWQACIPADSVWPILPDDVRDLLHATSGQHRVESFPLPAGLAGGSMPVPMLYALDSRVSYFRAAGALGSGPVTQDEVDVFYPHRDGWYRVQAIVPRDWQHVGILPLQADGAQGRYQWEWPREPDRIFETWCGDKELLVALFPFPSSCARCHEGRHGHAANPVPAPCPAHGWRIHIRERILLAPLTSRRPLDTWRNRLQSAYEELDRQRPVTPVRTVAAKAIRAILLTTIGTFHRTQRPRLRKAPLTSGDYPNGVQLEVVHLASGEDVALWKEPARMSVTPTTHPEWSVMIYSRVRAGMLLARQGREKVPVGMLTLPPEQVAAVAGDCLYLTADPGWPDEGRPGDLRVKERLPGPHRWTGDGWSADEDGVLATDTDEDGALAVGEGGVSA